MREYEVTIIIKPNLDDDSRNELIERVGGWLTPDEEAAHKPVVNQWGQRKLAYPINNYRDGYYVFYDATMEPRRMVDVEREILYVEDILRHLVVRKDE